jgi:CelD/BcsL family acetyltransferase involved in cellulose biosynthesis
VTTTATLMEHRGIRPSTTTSLLAEVEAIDVTFHEHISASYQAWLRLYGNDPAGCPLQHPEVILAELALQRTSRLEPYLVHTLRNRGSSGAGALIPKTISTTRLGAWPRGCELAGYRLAGGRFLTDSPEPELQQELLRASLKKIVDEQAAFLVIDDLDVESPLARCLQSLPAGWKAFRHAGVQPHRRIRLPDTPGEYWDSFSSKTRQTFRRKLKKFGETRLRRITSISDVPDFLEAAHRISRQTWQTRQFGLRIANDYEELVTYIKLAELGLLRSYLWYVGDQPVAFTVGNQDHGTFHYEEVGYLPEYARNSPGQMMLIQMLDDLMTCDRATWFDFGGGDADYKQLFANQASESGTVWLFPATWRGTLQHQHLSLSRRLRQVIRSGVRTLGLTSRLRQWVRRGASAGDNQQGDTPNEPRHPQAAEAS